MRLARLGIERLAAGRGTSGVRSMEMSCEGPRDAQTTYARGDVYMEVTAEDMVLWLY